MLLSKNDLTEALKILATDASVFVPAQIDNVKKFVPWDGKSDIELIGNNVDLPPKDILFPHTEKMYTYKMGENIEVKEVINNAKQIIFGIRPCDMKSIDCMDKVFLEKGYIDSFYSRKRENTVLIAMGCKSVKRTCFCDSMSVDPNNAPNADVMVLDNAEGFVLEAYTDKGQEILDKLKSLLKNCGESSQNTQCELKVNMTEDLPEKLAGMFEDPIWDEVSRACIGCATCTYLCPTCYCFDIDSDNHGSEGAKFRCWDSCMFSDYTRMAGGHNPRPTKKERVRNRYMHKLSYFNERYGQVLCVGCGRCMDKCPAHLDISKFIDKVGEVN